MRYRIFLLIFAILPAPAYTTNLTIVPAITTSLAYSNNVFLTPTRPKESDFITQINPGLNVTGIGKRLNLALDYRMQNTLFQKNNEENNIKHQVQTSATAELAKKKFFVNLSGNFSQRNISPNGISDSLNLAPSSNTTDVLNYAINPYLIHRFNTFADSRISYTRAVTDFNNNDNDAIDRDSQNQALEARLASGTQFIRWLWNLSYQYRTEDRDNININSTQFQRYLLDSRTSLTHSNNTRLILKVGYESNDYGFSVTDKVSGAEWGIGISWSPSTRSTIEMIAGKRYFGSTYQLLIAHQGRNLNLNVDYIEEITTTNSIQRNNSVFDLNGNVIDDPTASTNLNIVLNKQLTGRLEYNRRRLTTNLLLSIATRESLQNQQTEDNYRLFPTLTLTLNRHSSVTISAEWTQRMFFLQRRKDEKYESSLTINHRLSRKASTTLMYSYLDQNSTIDAFSYSRNLISIGLTMAF